MVKETYVPARIRISDFLSLKERALIISANITSYLRLRPMSQKPTSKKPTEDCQYLHVFPTYSHAHYLCRALRYHPDKGGDPEYFKEVSHAYVSMWRQSFSSPTN